MRALVSSISAVPRLLEAPVVRRKDPPSSAAFVDEDDDFGGEHLMYAGVSIPTEELPSGNYSSLPKIDATKKNPQLSIEELLYMNEVRPDGRVRGSSYRGRVTGFTSRNDVRTVPSAPIPMEEGTPSTRRGRPVSQNDPAMPACVRTMSTYDNRGMRSRLICYLCYSVGRISRSCIIDPIKKAYQVLSSWHNLTDAERSRFGSASMQIALLRANENLTNLFRQLRSTGISA